jgi:translation initiation factor 1
VSDPKKTGSPFAALEKLRGALPPGPEQPAVAEKKDEKGPAAFRGKLVVARTKRGRGGKTVTTIAGITGGETVLEEIARSARHALGCGAGVEDGMVVVQGDQVKRLAAWLEGQGARRVVIGTV